MATTPSTPQFDLSHDDCWAKLGKVSVYRQIPHGATYGPTDPWRGSGRFGDGSRLVLYLSSTDEGAMAEYFRRHPELIDLQDDLRLQLFRVELSVNGRSLDLRNQPCQNKVGINEESLTSSEHDEEVRYRLCRALAGRVADIGTGICSLSAAIGKGVWTLVLFDEPGTDWVATAFTPHPRPKVSANKIRPIQRP